MYQTTWMVLEFEWELDAEWWSELRGGSASRCASEYNLVSLLVEDTDQVRSSEGTEGIPGCVDSGDQAPSKAGRLPTL